MKLKHVQFMDGVMTGMGAYMLFNAFKEWSILSYCVGALGIFDGFPISILLGTYEGLNDE